MFEITMPAIWPWSVKGSRWLTADRDLSWTGHWVSQFNWIVNWHQTTMPWNSSGNVYPCLSANWKSSFGRHVHTGALITMPAVPWQRLAKFRWTYTRRWQISTGHSRFGRVTSRFGGENLIITRRMLIVWSNRNWNNLQIIRELNSLYRGSIWIRICG